MRLTIFTLLPVLLTGCATTGGGKTAAERAAELRRYREQKAAQESGSTATAEEKSTEETPAAPPAESAPTPSASETRVEAPTAPATPAEPVGPRSGLFGLRATVLGGSLATGQQAGSSSTLGLRYFVSDSVAVNVDAGFAYASVRDTAVTGLALGLGLNVFGGTAGAPFRPFFALEGSLNQVGSGNTNSTLASFAAGGGAEYWLAPQLSVSTSLMVGLATEPNQEVLVIGTFRPALGVTLYTN